MRAPAIYRCGPGGCGGFRCMKPFAKNFWRMSGQAGGGIVEIGGADASAMPKTPEALNVCRPESCRATAMRLNEYAMRGTNRAWGSLRKYLGSDRKSTRL